MSKVGKCSECGKLSDGLMTCYFTDGNEIELCPTCMKEDGSFCYGCGQFCAGMESFDFHHPGYCDTCWDEIEAADDWDDMEEVNYDPF